MTTLTILALLALSPTSRAESSGSRVDPGSSYYVPGMVPIGTAPSREFVVAKGLPEGNAAPVRIGVSEEKSPASAIPRKVKWSIVISTGILPAVKASLLEIRTGKKTWFIKETSTAYYSAVVPFTR